MQTFTRKDKIHFRYKNHVQFFFLMHKMSRKKNLHKENTKKIKHET